MAPETCPQCGASVPRNARSCPGCGSDERTGWSEEAYGQSLDLPDDHFNYDEFVREEFGKPARAKPRGIHWFWWIVAVVVLIGFGYYWLSSLLH